MRTPADLPVAAPQSASVPPALWVAAAVRILVDLSVVATQLASVRVAFSGCQAGGQDRTMVVGSSIAPVVGRVVGPLMTNRWE